MRILTLLIIALSNSPAYAKIYKCIVNGQTKFQETPCPKNSSSGGEIEVKPNIVSTKGLREYMKQDRIPKKLRDQKEKNARKARRVWMSGEVAIFSTQHKKLLKQKKLELRQREQEKKSRDDKKNK